jgi:hypothetical protein
MPAAAARLVPAAVFLALLTRPWWPLPMRWQTNDDPAILDFVSRGFDPAFICLLPGRLLAAGHRLLGPDAPLYAWMLLAALAACAATFAAALPLLRPGPARDPARVLAAVSYAALLAALLVSPTFTTVAAALAGHAVLALLAFPGRRGAVLAGLLAAGAGLLRLDALRLTCVVAAPALLLALRADPALRRRLLPAAAALAAVAGAETALRVLTTSPAHREYAAYNAVRGQLHDNPVLKHQRGNPDLLRALGWHEDDYTLFTHWIFNDETRYSRANLETLANFPLPPAAETAAAVPAAEKLRRFLLDRSHFTGALGALLLLGLLCPPGLARRTLVATALTGLAFGFGLQEWLRLPVRVRESILLVAALSALPALLRAPPPGPGRARALALVAGAFIVWRGGIVAESARATTAWQEQVRPEVERAGALYPGKRLLVWVAHQPALECFHPFHPVRPGYESILFGWTTFSEPYYADLPRLLGVTRGADVFRAIATRPDIVLVVPQGALDLLLRCIQRDTGLTPAFVPAEPVFGCPAWVPAPGSRAP